MRIPSVWDENSLCFGPLAVASVVPLACLLIVLLRP